MRDARLLEPVQRGSSVLKVRNDLDWRSGDRIYIAPTGTDSTHSEYRTIFEYTGGKLFLDSALEHYHYGAESSTELQYNGVDIRGEIILLSRNIVIDGFDDQGGDFGA